MASKELRDLEDILNDRDKEFCRQLVIQKGNSFRAAKKAGFAESTAKSRACEWIRKTRAESSKPQLFDYYQLLLNDAVTTVGITIENVLSELKSLALSDITKVVELNGGLSIKVKKTSEIPDEIKPAIASISKTNYGITVKFHDKIGALKMLLDYLSITDDKAKGNITIDKLEFHVKGSQSKLLTDHGKSQKN